MAKIYTSAEQLIGNTPLLKLANIQKKFGLTAEILGKLEYFNPAGSVKDRAAKAMLDDAEARGLLRKGSVIIEPTSGNTGIGLAAVAAARGYKTVIVMPDSMSAERRNLLRAYGAELVLTDGAKGMKGAIAAAEEIAAKTEGGFLAGQFYNPANPRAHELTTGPEIWNDTDGKVDAFVAGVGTGGTLSGAGRYLKGKNPAIKVIAVEPSSSAVLSGGRAGAHGIQGLGAGFIPENLDLSVCDEVIAVTEQEAYRFGAEAAKTEGILVGISSGAALCAAVKLAEREEYAGKKIVVIFPDTGERYLTTDMFGGCPPLL